MDINISKILSSLSNEFDPNAAGEPNLTDQEMEVRQNMRTILLGYKNGQVAIECELVEGKYIVVVIMPNNTN